MTLASASVYGSLQHLQADAGEGSSAIKPIFIHAGHTSTVEDFSWSASDPWMLASTAQDNTLHVWQMAPRTGLHRTASHSSVPHGAPALADGV